MYLCSRNPGVTPMLPTMEIGALRLNTYWLLYSIAIATAGLLAYRRLLRGGVTARQALNGLLLIFWGGLAGSVVLKGLAVALRDLALTGVLAVGLDQGSAFLGALIGGVGAGWLWFRSAGVPLGRAFDLCIVPVPLGQAIGRLGCLAAGCCYGKPTDSWLGLYLPDHDGFWAVRYPTPLLSAAADLLIFSVESLTAQPADGAATTAYFRTTLGTAAVANRAAPPETAETSPKAPAAPVDMWTVRRWYKREIPITSAQCQQAVDLLQSDAAFVALQLPEPPHETGQSSLLPVYRNAKIELVGGDGLNVQGEGSFRPERFTFAANELPQTPGKIWVTFGAVTTPTLTCPAGKRTADWEIALDFQLDLSYVPNNCQGCTLDVFLCYEGQELPGSRLAKYVARQQANRVLEKLVRATAAGAGVQDYRDWGVTCAGPLPLQLLDDPDWNRWMLVGASAQAVTPTWPITLSHRLEGGNFHPPALMDLAFSSNLQANWQWSNGAQIITPPIDYDGYKDIYLVGQVPVGAAAGMYSVQITASMHSQPTDYRVATDLIWVGEWLPPPQGGPSRKLYLPLVMK